MWNKTSRRARYWMPRISRGLERIKALVIAVMCMVAAPTVCSAQVTVTVADYDDVPTEQVEIAKDTVDIMQRSMESEFGATLDTDVVITLHNGNNPDSNRTKGNAELGAINIWLEKNDPEFKVAFLVSHELTHQYQIERVGKETLNQNMWFTEGMADIIGARTANHYSNGQFKAFARSAYYKTKSGRPVHLYEHERRWNWLDGYNNGVPVYAKADLAMIYLNSKYQPMLMWSYLYMLKNCGNASDALKNTYGITTRELDKLIG